MQHPRVRACQVCSRNSKGAKVARADRMKGNLMVDQVTELRKSQGDIVVRTSTFIVRKAVGEL